MSKPFYTMICNPSTALTSPTVLRSCRRHLVLYEQFEKCPAADQLIELYRELRHDGHYIILDNGAHEGKVAEDEEYVDLARRLQPNMVVLPDEVGAHSVFSIERSMKFFHQYKEVLDPMTEWMFAGQGCSTDDVIDCYVWAVRNLASHRFCLGLGQSYLQFASTGQPQEVDRESTRERLVHRLIQAVPSHVLRRWSFHVLGGRYEIDSNWTMLNLLNVVGLDSIKPLSSAFAGAGLLSSRIISEIDDPRNTLKVPALDLWHSNIDSFCRQYGLQRGMGND